jgi:hypothetical protein
MSARPSKPGQIGRNGKSMRTQKERAAQQKRYAERSTLRAQGVPENKLPPILKLRSLNNSVVWAKNKGPAKRSSDEKKKADQRVYQARSNAKRDGKPQPPLPSRGLTPEEHAAAQREHAQQVDSVQ